MINNYQDLAHALMPETALVFGALVVLAFDLVAGRKLTPDARVRANSVIAILALLSALTGALAAGVVGPVFGGVLMLDTLALASRLGVLALALLTVTIATGARRPQQPAEFLALVLFATAGFTLMAAAQQLLLVFLAIELASISLYVLTGFDKSRPESAEAGLKYFLFGGMSAAFLLFGFSLIYGLTNSIDLADIAAQLAVHGLSPLLIVALVMILVAFGFKSAAAPFHLWAPDVYEGAPTTSAALIASASKLAGFTVFLRLLWPGLGGVGGSASTAQLVPGWIPVVAMISAASLLLGNIGALAQTNLRRLLAYSAIAHAGAMLLGVIASRATPGPLYFYVATYGLATVGAFGVIAIIERTTACRQISDLAGLHRRSPLLAACLLIFILSLAGVPPLAGFFGKFTVFAAALQLGGLAGPVGWLTVLAIFLSAVALYYYLVILKQALVAAPATDAAPLRTPPVAGFALVVTAALLVLFGVAPSLLLGLF